MKILFVIPKIKNFYGKEIHIEPPAPHIGIAYIIAALKKAGFDKNYVFDHSIEKTNILLSKIDNIKPEIIGITAYSYAFDFVLDLSNEIKKYTKTPVIIGGPHVSCVKKELLETTVADFGMYGEGEESFLHFVKEFYGKRNYESVDNLIWRTKDKKIIINQMHPFINNLDSIPLPAYDNFDWEKYACYSNKRIGITTSRGAVHTDVIFVL